MDLIPLIDEEQVLIAMRQSDSVYQFSVGIEFMKLGRKAFHLNYSVGSSDRKSPRHFTLGEYRN